MRANIQAFAAYVDAGAAYAQPVKFRVKTLRLRAVTPRTSQRAALEKHSSSHSGPVLYAETLDIVYLSGHLSSVPAFLSYWGCELLARKNRIMCGLEARAPSKCLASFRTIVAVLL